MEIRGDCVLVKMMLDTYLISHSGAMSSKSLLKNILCALASLRENVQDGIAYYKIRGDWCFNN